jgi:hypothetical protein
LHSSPAPFESPFLGRRLSPAERAAELTAAERAFRRRRRRRWARALAGVGASLAAGLALIGYALHTADEGWGLIAFWGGLLVGNVGGFVTLLLTYMEAEANGDL